MCLQCMTKPDVFNARIGEFALMRATKDAYSTGDPNWEKDEFGLVQCNDPTFYFKTQPLPVKAEWINKSIDVPDEEFDAYFEAHDRAAIIEAEIMRGVEGLRQVADLLTSIEFTEEKNVRLLLMAKLHEAVKSGFKTEEELNKENQVLDEELENLVEEDAGVAQG